MRISSRKIWFVKLFFVLIFVTILHAVSLLFIAEH
ncbi:MAG: hypothetical protein RL521_398, partial [Bacteroidota bacterium]